MEPRGATGGASPYIFAIGISRSGRYFFIVIILRLGVGIGKGG